MQPIAAASLFTAIVSLAPALAQAHISVVSGPGFANTTQEISFGVGHGCAGADTYRVSIDIPEGVTSIRPLTSGFGKASIAKDAAGNVTAITWQKADEDALESDVEYYKLTARMKLPDRAFTSLYFPAHQTCRAVDGTLTSVDWIAETEGTDVEVAPAVLLVPLRRSGWNKFTLPRAVTDLSLFFSDALIVWRGKAAYSANPVSAELILSTAGVSSLSELKANDEIWVRY